MDKFDLKKPLCIFVLDCNPDIDSGLTPVQIIQEYVQNSKDGCNTSTGSNEQEALPVPCPAIRGSTLPFGGWGNPKKAVRISKFHYALTINNPIPCGSEYKWLDVSGKGLEGDIDPATQYSYEPRPFIDRPIKFRTPVPGEEILIVMDRWGNYTSKIEYTRLGKWIKQKKFAVALDNINVEQDKIEIETSPDIVMGNRQVHQAFKADEYEIIEVDKPSENKMECLEHQFIPKVQNVQTEDERQQQMDQISSRVNLKYPDKPEEITCEEYMVKEKTTSSSYTVQTSNGVHDVSGDHTSLVSIKEEVEKSSVANVMEIPIKKEVEVLTSLPPDTAVANDKNKAANYSEQLDSVMTKDVEGSRTELQIDEVFSSRTRLSNRKSEAVVNVSEPKNAKTRQVTAASSKGKATGTKDTKESTSSTTQVSSKTKARTMTSERRVTKTTTTSVGSEPVKMRSTRGKPPERPQSLIERGTTNRTSTNRPLRSGFSQNLRPFSLSADMKFSRFRRSTEEIFIERTSPRSPYRTGSSSSGSESFLSSPVSLNSGEVSPGKVEDSVFGDKLEDASEDQPQGDEKLSKVVVKNVFSDMLSKARKISSDFQKKDSPNYRQSSTMYQRDYRTINRQSTYGSSTRSTVTPDRYVPSRHSFFSRGAAKSESSLLFSSPPDNRRETERVVKTVRRERPISTEVTVSESTGQLQNEIYEAQENVLEEISDNVHETKPKETFNGSETKDSVKVDKLDESLEITTEDDNYAMQSIDSRELSQDKNVKRELQFERTKSELPKNKGSKDRAETDDTAESAADNDGSSILAAQQASTDEVLKSLTDDESKTTDYSDERSSKTKEHSEESIPEKDDRVTAAEEDIETLDANLNPPKDSLVNKEASDNYGEMDKLNESFDKTERGEKEVVLSNMTSFELEKDSGPQVMVSSDTLGSISYNEPVLAPSVDNGNFNKSSKNSSSTVGDKSGDETNAKPDEKSIARPRLGSAKSNKSFEAIVETEDGLDTLDDTKEKTQDAMDAKSAEISRSRPPLGSTKSFKSFGSSVDIDDGLDISDDKTVKTQDETDAKAAETSRARPRLGSTKSYKSFDASFDGEEYVVVDLPSGSSVSDDESDDRKKCDVENEVNKTEVSRDGCSNLMEERTGKTDKTDDNQSVTDRVDVQENLDDNEKENVTDESCVSSPNGKAKILTEKQDKVSLKTQDNVSSETQDKVSLETQANVSAETQDKVSAETQDKVSSETKNDISSETQELFIPVIESSVSGANTVYDSNISHVENDFAADIRCPIKPDADYSVEPTDNSLGNNMPTSALVHKTSDDMYGPIEAAENTAVLNSEPTSALVHKTSDDIMGPLEAAENTAVLNSEPTSALVHKTSDDILGPIEAAEDTAVLNSEDTSDLVHKTSDDMYGPIKAAENTAVLNSEPTSALMHKTSDDMYGPLEAAENTAVLNSEPTSALMHKTSDDIMGHLEAAENTAVLNIEKQTYNPLGNELNSTYKIQDTSDDHLHEKSTEAVPGPKEQTGDNNVPSSENETGSSFGDDGVLGTNKPQQICKVSTGPKEPNEHGRRVNCAEQMDNALEIDVKTSTEELQSTSDDSVLEKTGDSIMSPTETSGKDKMGSIKPDRDDIERKAEKQPDNILENDIVPENKERQLKDAVKGEDTDFEEQTYTEKSETETVDVESPEVDRYPQDVSNNPEASSDKASEMTKLSQVSANFPAFTNGGSDTLDSECMISTRFDGTKDEQLQVVTVEKKTEILELSSVPDIQLTQDTHTLNDTDGFEITDLILKEDQPNDKAMSSDEEKKIPEDQQQCSEMNTLSEDRFPVKQDNSPNGDIKSRAQKSDSAGEAESGKFSEEELVSTTDDGIINQEDARICAETNDEGYSKETMRPPCSLTEGSTGNMNDQTNDLNNSPQESDDLAFRLKKSLETSDSVENREQVLNVACHEGTVIVDDNLDQYDSVVADLVDGKAMECSGVDAKQDVISLSSASPSDHLKPKDTVAANIDILHERPSTKDKTMGSSSASSKEDGSPETISDECVFTGNKKEPALEISDPSVSIDTVSSSSKPVVPEKATKKKRSKEKRNRKETSESEEQNLGSSVTVQSHENKNEINSPVDKSASVKENGGPETCPDEKAFTEPEKQFPVSSEKDSTGLSASINTPSNTSKPVHTETVTKKEKKEGKRGKGKRSVPLDESVMESSITGLGSENKTEINSPEEEKVSLKENGGPESVSDEHAFTEHDKQFPISSEKEGTHSSASIDASSSSSKPVDIENGTKKKSGKGKRKQKNTSESVPLDETTLNSSVTGLGFENKKEISQEEEETVSSQSSERETSLASESIDTVSSSSKPIDTEKAAKKKRGKDKRKQKDTSETVPPKDELDIGKAENIPEKSDKDGDAIPPSTADIEENKTSKKSFASVLKTGKPKSVSSVGGSSNGNEAKKLHHDTKSVMETNVLPQDDMVHTKSDESENAEDLSNDEGGIETHEPERDTALDEVKPKDVTKKLNDTSVKKPQPPKPTVRQRKGKGKGNKGGKRKNDQWKAPVESDDTAEELTTSDPPYPVGVPGRNICLILFFVILAIALCVGLYFAWYDHRTPANTEL